VEQLNLENAIIQLWVFVIGTVIGSFLNVCIYRIPEKVSLLRPRSSCVRCNAAIAWYDNIPVVSFLILKGRCRYCNHKISIGYPIVEVITGIAFWLLFHFFPLRDTSFFFYCIYLTFCCLLIVCSFVDLKLHIIPNEVSYTGLVLAPLASLVYPDFLVLGGSAWVFNGIGNQWIHSFLASLLGILVGGGLIYLCALIGKVVLKKDAMGFGDVKLMGVIGGFLGWKLSVTTFFMAPFLGLLFAIPKLVFNKERMIPYGPFLSLAAFICLLYTDVCSGIIDNYVDIFLYFFNH